MKEQRILGFILLTILASACSILGGDQTPESAQADLATIEATNTPVAPETQAPAPTPEPAETIIIVTATPEVTVAQPTQSQQPTSSDVTATVKAQVINLRDGPGTLFPIQLGYQEGTIVTVLGKAPGDEWLQVRTPDQKKDWMAMAFLNVSGDISAVPVVEPTGSLVIPGRVVATDGTLIPGVDVAIISPQTGLRADAISDANGEFYAYIPSTLEGEWDVSIVGVSCTSLIMDEDCIQQYIQIDDDKTVTLPGDVSIEFQYEPASTTIEGTVVDQNGKPVGGIRVFAEREDGALVHGTANTAGGFSLPVTDGVWTLYTVRLDPYVTGPLVDVTIENQKAAEDVELVAPN